MGTDHQRLGIITGEHAPELSEDGKRLVEILADRGVEAEPIRWDDPTVRWEGYDGVLFRSCWGYPTDLERFRTVLAELDRRDLPVCNPLPVIRWNMHKSYLEDLADAGVRLPATAVIESGSEVSLAAVIDRHEWDEVVVKPGIGSFSRDVRRVSRSALDDGAAHFRDLLGGGDVVVQEFVPEITDGERSIVFFEGTYSHAWNSRTASDDVTEFDEIDATYEPPASIRDQAAATLHGTTETLGGCSGPLPYARVDYVHRNGDLLLMELELIEPYLGLDRGTNAVERFADAVAAYFT